MSGEYFLRIKPVLLADDDGTNQATITAAGIQSRVDIVNTVYATAGVKIKFDPAIDVLQVTSSLLNRSFTVLDKPDVGTDKWSKEPAVDATTHDGARWGFARLFPGKLVVFFRKRVQLIESNGVWEVAGSGGASSGRSMYVDMPGSGGDLTLLAHEMGHYLQLPHPFVSGVKTVADAASKIKGFVESGQASVARGLEALDGDRYWVTDTPSDARGSIFESEGLDRCGTVGQITIPVKFGDGTSHDYTLKPDRSNIMSYFKDCPGNKSLSLQQARRMRDSLEMGLRHDLISPKPRPDLQLFGAATAKAGAVSMIDLVMMRAGRVVTAVRDGSGNLKVIVWDVVDGGAQVIRKGDASAGAVGQIALANAGPDLVTTAVIDDAENLKIIVWQVDEEGNVTRKESAGAAGKITNLASCRADLNYVATVARVSDGSFRMDIWRVMADGSIFLAAKATAGAVNAPQSGVTTPRLSICSIEAYGLLTPVRNSSGDLKLILWNLKKEVVTRLDDAIPGEASVGEIDICALSREVAVTAIKDKGNDLKLRALAVVGGSFVDMRGSATAGSISDIAVCRMGTELLITAVRDDPGNLKLIAWQVSPDGNTIVRRDDAVDEPFSRLAICQAGDSSFVTATRDQNGDLRVRAWQLKSPVQIGLSDDFLGSVLAKSRDMKLAEMGNQDLQDDLEVST
jgi:WD40 repeat protein